MGVQVLPKSGLRGECFTRCLLFSSRFSFKHWYENALVIVEYEACNIPFFIGLVLNSSSLKMNTLEYLSLKNEENMRTMIFCL